MTSDAGTRVLVVDDDESLRTVISQVLSEDGHRVTEVDSGEAAIALFEEESFSLVVSDIYMGGMSGLGLLGKIKERRDDTQVIIMTSNASLAIAVDALRLGAYDFLVKPFEDLDLISAAASRAIEKVRLIEENRRLIEELEGRNEALKEQARSLQEQAIRDGLTGLFNHRYFQELITTEILRVRRQKSLFSLLFLDIDYFKRYNDTHGHPEGDKLLRGLGEVLKECLRGSDILARYGGEEFVLLLPETPKAMALKVAEKIRARVADTPFTGRETQPLGRVTLSMGVASYPEDGEEAAAIIERADQALFRAKRNGRNRVESG